MERFNFNYHEVNLGDLFLRSNSNENFIMNVNQIHCNANGVCEFVIETTRPDIFGQMIDRIVEQNIVIRISRIIFSGPCTILFIKDYKSLKTTKTIVRCTDLEKFDWKKGAMMALLKYRLPKRAWKDFVKRYHEHPKKEAEAAEMLLRYMIGDCRFDDYIFMAKKAWKACKDDSQK